ncbi:hypothetical protein ACPCHQ_22140 [Ralstonia thomasii]|uniref:hypothetical protein n=1 Tax=Ralstonia thomasii TaxID=3058596 RepID=UPI003C2BE86B
MKFTSDNQIAEYLTSAGLQQASTGGGYSAWFLPAASGIRRWQIAITNDQDTAPLAPGTPVVIALEDPEGVPVECEDLPSPDFLPDALARYIAPGKNRFG